MKTFEEYLTEDTGEVDLTEDFEIMQEATYTSTHSQPAHKMAEVHKNVLKADGHKIIQHTTTPTGDHKIISKNKRGAVRVHQITTNSAGHTQIVNRPAAHHEQNQHG